MSSSPRAPGPYRAKNRLFLGVVAGLCRHYGFSPFFPRLVVLGLAVLTTFWVVLVVYLAAAMIMPREPAGASWSP
ncbi:MAG: PspC domain-containing protein [Deltaproteobacteria bacterium]|jgi:phage shock protein PspC (stress-responsive transcriptional regulator)|nr:PspC domain-containing protein [Deltaproteobacteria bacterium]